jgi:micrococcal nuclease
MKTKLCGLLVFLLVLISLSTSSSKQLVRLSYVIDGDTIIVDGNKKVRYIGINSSELKTKTKPDECFAKEAFNANKRLLENKQLFIQKDISEIDKYGRLLRYVWADNPATGSGQVIFVNDYLIRNGFAKIATYPPDTKYYFQFKQAEKEAKENNRGLWSQCPSSVGDGEKR